MTPGREVFGGKRRRSCNRDGGDKLRLTTENKQKLRGDWQQFTSCWETPAQLRLGVGSGIVFPNVRPNDCDR